MLDKGLRELGWVPTQVDPTIYVLISPKGKLLLKVFVDDMMLATSRLLVVEEHQQGIMSTWAARDLGELAHYIGMKIQRDRLAGTLTISQPKLTAQILQLTGMTDVNPCALPVPTGTQLEEPGDVDPAFTLNGMSYLQIVGKLSYLVQCTRPDLAYAQMLLSRHMQRPGAECWKLLKHVLRYLAGTRTVGITYHRASGIDLHVYCDADFANLRADRKSIGAYVVLMAGAAVAWCCRKQSLVATSTAHAEYMAAYEATRQVTYMRGLCMQFGVLAADAAATIVHCDNEAAVAVASTEGVTERNKHWEVKYHYVRQQQQRKVVKLQWVDTKAQLADLLTKAVPRDGFQRLGRQLGLDLPTKPVRVLDPG